MVTHSGREPLILGGEWENGIRSEDLGTDLLYAVAERQSRARDGHWQVRWDENKDGTSKVRCEGESHGVLCHLCSFRMGLLPKLIDWDENERERRKPWPREQDHSIPLEWMKPAISFHLVAGNGIYGQCDTWTQLWEKISYQPKCEEVRATIFHYKHRN